MSQGPIIRSFMHEYAQSRQVWARDGKQESQLEGTGKKLAVGPISFFAPFVGATRSAGGQPTFGCFQAPHCPLSAKKAPSECLINAPISRRSYSQIWPPTSIY